MTEERRTASPPVDPGTVPDLADLERPPVALDGRVPSAAPSAPSIGDADSPPPSRTSTGARRRGRMTLRIPDDEVSRPSIERESAPPPSVHPPPVAPLPSVEPAVMLVPMRIISINPNPAESSGPPPPLEPEPPSPPVEPPPEDSWTPFQPTVVDDLTVPQPPVVARAPLPSEDLVIPIHDEIHDELLVEDPQATEPPPESLEPEDIQPVQSTPAPPPPAHSDPDGEDIRFDDDQPPPTMPPPTPRMEGAPSNSGGAGSDRMSDPGAEIAPEDLVAVEAVAPPKAPASLPPMRPRLQSQPPSMQGPRRGSVQPLPPLKAPLVIVPPHVGTVAPQGAEGSGLRRKGRLWWEDLFNDDYLRTCEKLTEEQIAHEVDFIEDSLGIERGGAVLDLACGTGRHSIELARRGYEVVGFDLSLAMLARAGDEAQDREAKLNFVQGDMREMTFEEQFDGIYCWNTSFGYFEEDKNAHVIDRIHHALKGGGLFLLDVINRDFLIRQSPSLAWFEGDGCVCMDEMSVDFITSRMKIKRTMMLDDGRSREIEYSMRIYSLHELGKILHEHGFKVCEVSGRVAMPGVYFGNESPRTIILAERR
jgi:SAM-dependent methyltransferase